MSSNARIHSLEQKHQSLEAELSELMSRPSVSDEQIAVLKRKKLQLKDEIGRLRLEAA